MKGIIVAGMAFIVVFFTRAAGSVSDVNAACMSMTRTGQVTCYDNEGKVIDCNNTGQDGEHQIGMAWLAPRFIDYGNGTVLDNATNLIWTKNAQQIKGTKKWIDAITACNNFDFAGYSDWRLPNVKELLSLIDYEHHDPALAPGHPFDNVQFIFYWSSTTYDATPINAWGVYLCNGYVFNYHKTTSAYVWPVRSRQ